MIKKIKILAIIFLTGLTFISCNVNNKIIENKTEKKGYSIKTDKKTNEKYYIIENDYEKEYHIEEIFSDNYKNNTYPELKPKGQILNYQEYIEYCKLFNIILWKFRFLD